MRAGEQIAATLAQRAEVNATTRKHALTVLTDTLQILNDLRRAVVTEIARTLGMPRDLERQIFGYFDVLEMNRIEAKRMLEQNQSLVGPMSTRGLTLPPPSTRMIPAPPISNRGYSLGPSSMRLIPPPPPRESNS